MGAIEDSTELYPIKDGGPSRVLMRERVDCDAVGLNSIAHQQFRASLVRLGATGVMEDGPTAGNSAVFPDLPDSPLYIRYVPPTESPKPPIVHRLTRQDKQGLTPLHVAAECGHINVVEALCNKCSPVNMTDVDGNTPLHLAIRSGHTDVALELLKRGADKEICNNAGDTAIDVAKRYGHTDLATTLARVIVVHQ